MATPSYPSALTSTVLSTDRGVVTCMHVTAKHIVIGLDNGNLHVLDHGGGNERVVKASEKGHWAIDVWNDEWVVAGGVDGVLGVWDLGSLRKTVDLHGHNSTVRCVKAASSTRVISSSRDTTLRIWNIDTGECEGVLEGHTQSVRSFAVHRDLIASASYDCDGRVWSLEKRECIHVLKGHESQLYSVAFDGARIVTGGLDKTARVWDPASGACLAVLRGFSSLVGQLQLFPDTLLTGDSGGDLRVWSMKDYAELRRMNANDNSVTSMQSDGSKIVSGGSDGRVKEWDFENGKLLRELVVSDAVWKVGFAGGRIAAVFSKEGKVVLGIWEASTTR